ncbi:MAG: VWA domain-containing protein [Planctomycetaceae bacterium]|jgi:Ca-activated chloride channel family protein|nr:VWA domain-containing protein [Planctomycetaceae bacterium]
MFERPFYLLLLWLIPLLGLLLWYAFQQKRRDAAAFLDEPMLVRLMPAFDAARSIRRSLLLLLSLMSGIFAAAGPQFGTYYEEVSRNGVDVFILLDVSRSMLAEDILPYRLQRAKSDIRDLLERVTGDRVGLIVFAGKPILKVPLTTDQPFFLHILESVNTDSAPRGGTAVGDAVRSALRAMPPEAGRQRAIVLITDGEDQESMPLDAAKDAAAQNVKILTVGLGDPNEGGRIPIRDKNGNLSYLKYEGKEVWTKPDEQTLMEMARLTKGAHVPAGINSFDLGQIYADSIGKMQGNSDHADKPEHRKKFRHQYQIFLAAAVLGLLLYAAVPEYPPHHRKHLI